MLSDDSSVGPDFPQLQPSLPLFSSSSSSLLPLYSSLLLLSFSLFLFLNIISPLFSFTSLDLLVGPRLSHGFGAENLEKKICLTHVIDAFCSTAFLLPDFSTPTNSFQPPNIISINQHLHLRNLRLQLGFQLHLPAVQTSPPSLLILPSPRGACRPTRLPTWC